MPDTSTELVVPAKVLPSFNGAIAVPNEYSAFEKPEKGKLRVRYYLQKSALITGPLVTMGTVAGDMAVAQSGIDFNALSAVAILMGSVFTITGGLFATLAGTLSLARGDGYFTPFRPTKTYLESRKHLEDKILMPFDAWDNLFERANIKEIES